MRSNGILFPLSNQPLNVRCGEVHVEVGTKRVSGRYRCGVVPSGERYREVKTTEWLTHTAAPALYIVGQ